MRVVRPAGESDGADGPREVVVGVTVEEEALAILAVRAGFTPIRGVCRNTLSMGHGSDASRLVRVQQTQFVFGNRFHQVRRCTALRSILLVETVTPCRSPHIRTSSQVESVPGLNRVALWNVLHDLAYLA